MSWTMSHASIFDKNRIYVLAYQANQVGTRVFRWTGKWDNYFLPFVTAGICSVHGTDPEILSLGIQGQIHSASPSGQHIEIIDNSKEGPLHRGVLRGIRTINNIPYVWGMGRQVYRRTIKNSWARFDENTLDPIGSKNVVGFESLDGFDEKNIWAVGIGGEIWARTNEWMMLPKTTNQNLLGVLCTPMGKIYAVGGGGLILVSDGGGFSPIEQNLTSETLWDVVWHDGSVWVSGVQGVFKIVDDKLLSASPESATKFRYLCAKDDLLWSIGESEIWERSRGSWSTIVIPQAVTK